MTSDLHAGLGTGPNIDVEATRIALRYAREGIMLRDAEAQLLDDLADALPSLVAALEDRAREPEAWAVVSPFNKVVSVTMGDIEAKGCAGWLTERLGDKPGEYTVEPLFRAARASQETTRDEVTEILQASAPSSPPTPETPTEKPVIDLMAALKESLAKWRPSVGEREPE